MKIILSYLIKLLSYFSNSEQKNSGPILDRLLNSSKPCMIARFGSTEIKAILYPYFPLYLKAIFRNRIFRNMEILSGFFPTTEKSISQFSRLMIEDMRELDVLGSWRVEELFLKNNFPNAKLVSLNDLEPYLSNDPWSKVLEDKNVLVVHPFATTIENQYLINRTNLFNDNRVLPKFKSLQTIKAVQTIAGNQSQFNDWFEALEHMKLQITKLEFDVAIIGCGAYGFPLAAHVKRMGKKAIHLGGATQVLFGIKGKRWIENKKFDSIINKYFVFPGPEEQVINSSKVENGCYW